MNVSQCLDLSLTWKQQDASRHMDAGYYALAAESLADHNAELRDATRVDAHHEDVKYCGKSENGDVLFETVR